MSLGRIPRNKEQLLAHIRSRCIPNDRGCWLWQGSTNTKGYGNIRYAKKSCHVHKLTWELLNGEVPNRLCVLHSCDTPSCANPGHLFLGTNIENVKDKVRKGRQARNAGEVPWAKLTWDKVARIRSEYSAGTTQTQLAGQYGVTQANISEIVRHNTWR